MLGEIIPMESFEYYRDASGFWKVKNVKRRRRSTM